ncbi:hypothetical protein TESG_08388 [Trichophyton tonsurans CBS 112818]|uniref:Uncharacterized protein n=1 Tax=Trichophyton tonsurans (strain CBS 112818) TaxID=647933 RepID=F2RVZ9_TRIT1|nr:hypothetical protein TESG_08388 [Trichophyton tonsurans CBS 112818]
MKQCIAAFRGTQCRGIRRDNFSVLAAKYQPLSENNIMERPANVPRFIKPRRARLSKEVAVSRPNTRAQGASLEEPLETVASRRYKKKTQPPGLMYILSAAETALSSTSQTKWPVPFLDET